MTDLSPTEALERGQARATQALLEDQRLLAHQMLGIRLLTAGPDHQLVVIEGAQQEVLRWRERRLCSDDYIDRWTHWLQLPTGELVQRMCSDAAGWGPAMRQNSPFLVGR